VTSISASITIDAPAELAWAVLTDWAGQGSWMPLTDVEVEDGDGTLGTRMVARSGLGRLALVDPMRIDVWEPPHRCEVQHLGRVVTGRGVFGVDARAATQCVVTWEERLESTGIRKPIDAVAGPPTRLMLGIALRRLRRAVLARAVQ
jgi:carbon monoxide dehydrogenase subunit G